MSEPTVTAPAKDKYSVNGLTYTKMGLIALFVFARFFGLWFQAYMSQAQVSLLDLIGMSFRRVDPRVIVQAKIMAEQSGMGSEQETGITTHRLEAHYLAGGNVTNVIRAMIAAYRAHIDLDFERAAAIDLSGGDVLELVRSNVVTGKPLPRPTDSVARDPLGDRPA